MFKNTEGIQEKVIGNRSRGKRGEGGGEGLIYRHLATKVFSNTNEIKGEKMHSPLISFPI
jgi:hypothetical protein